MRPWRSATRLVGGGSRAARPIFIPNICGAWVGPACRRSPLAGGVTSSVSRARCRVDSTSTCVYYILFPRCPNTTNFLAASPEWWGHWQWGSLSYCSTNCIKSAITFATRGGQVASSCQLLVAYMLFAAGSAGWGAFLLALMLAGLRQGRICFACRGFVPLQHCCLLLAFP